MNWYFQDSKGVQGPLIEPQLRAILEKGFESTATVQQGESSWFAAETVRSKFEKLDQEGIYLRSDDKIYGPFVDRRADELKSQNPDQFDSYKIGKHGKWLVVEKPRKSESGTPDGSPPSPPSPPKATAPTISAKEAFAPLVSLAKQTANRIANNPRVQGAAEKAKEQFQNKTTNASSGPPDIPFPKPIEKKKTSSQKMVALGCGGCLLAPCLLAVVVMVFGSIIEAVAPEFAAESRAIAAAKERANLSDNTLKALAIEQGNWNYIEPSTFDDNQTRTKAVRDNAGKLTGFNVHLYKKYSRKHPLWKPYRDGDPYDFFVDLKGNVK